MSGPMLRIYPCLGSEILFPITRDFRRSAPFLRLLRVFKIFGVLVRSVLSVLLSGELFSQF